MSPSFFSRKQWKYGRLEQEGEPEPQAVSNTWLYAACVACVACTMVNLGLAFSRVPPTQVSTTLDRPSTYIGFHKLKFNATDATLENFAHAVAHIDRAHPDMVSLNVGRQTLTWAGTILPDDRRIQVSSTISTLVQFRIIDYGMETCRIAMSLPFVQDLEPERVESSGISHLRPQSVEIWDVDLSTHLDSRTATWATRPVRKRRITTFTVTEGMNELSEVVPCQSRTYLTLELACRDCSVDFWQDNALPRLGLYVQQSSSL